MKNSVNWNRDNQCVEVLSLYAWEFASMLDTRTVSWRRVEKLPPVETNIEFGEPVGE